MTDEKTSTNPHAGEPFGVQPPSSGAASAVTDATEEAEGQYVPRTYEPGPKVTATPELPKRTPHPGKPRRRTWVDNDGDLWWESKLKDNGEVYGFQEGSLARWIFRDMEATFGPLIELDSVNVTTAAENAIDQTMSAILGRIRQRAKEQENTIARAAMFELLKELESLTR